MTCVGAASLGKKWSATGLVLRTTSMTPRAERHRSDAPARHSYGRPKGRVLGRLIDAQRSSSSDFVQSAHSARRVRAEVVTGPAPKNARAPVP